MKNTIFTIFTVLLLATFNFAQVNITVTNNATVERIGETVEVNWDDLVKLNPNIKPNLVAVSENGKKLVTQTIDANSDGKPEKLIFQVDFKAGERIKNLSVEASASPTATIRTFGRFAPDRKDDFLWENDRVGFRTYGKALEVELVSSGIDVWAKRTREMVINDWLKPGNDAYYHTDNGKGLDFYSVKKSRGCGGAGIWDGKKLHVSRNYVSHKVLAKGPIRTQFELTYEPWDVNGVKVSEIKRFTIDAGQNFYRVESYYDSSDDLRDIHVAVGIAKHEPDFKGETDKGKTWQSLWETNEKNGSLGCAIIAEPTTFEQFAEYGNEFDFPMNLSIVAAKPDKQARYYVGAGWSRSGDFADKKAWLGYVENFSSRVASPLIATVISPAELANKRSQLLSHRLTNTLMNRVWLEDDGTPIGIPARWTYEQGVQMKAVEQVWYATGDPKYFDFIKRGMDYWMDKDGKIKYNLEEYNIDHVTPGRAFITLYRVTNDKKYKEISELIRSQLKTHPRTKEGGFWHKKIYPWQMWLDGLYMGQPFYAEYSMVWNEDNWNDIANQFVWMEKHARDQKTGLLYHGWDESKEQKWANKETGLSPHVWGRAMGWYAIALIDVLDYFPKNHPRRAELIAILNREAEAIAKYQDQKTGVWYDIIDLPERKPNYPESSASAMFVYSLAKGIRKGYLPEKYLKTVQTGWAGIKKEFIKELPDGNLDWEGTVSVSGLGGNPYRDGSFDYYMSEKLRTNDVKGLGPAVMAAVELEHLEKPQIGKGKTIMLDDHFNREVRADGSIWHYKWEEKNHPGYYAWGQQFESFGAKLDSLSSAPTAANLANASVYIIVDPDTEKETPKPNFISATDAKNIADWVKKGGVLVMLGNDFGNAEFDNWNVLAKQFGLEFNKDSKNRVQNDQYEQGRVIVPTGNPIFKNARDLYMKEISTLKISGKNAQTVLTLNDEPIVAVVKHGKGTVFALGDPWLYNEYVDGRKMNGLFQNFGASRELSAWLLAQAKKK